MPFVEKSGLKYFQFSSFQIPDLIHGIFTRLGGVSQIPWDSLNVGGLSGDSENNVIENRRRLFDAVGRDVGSLYDVWQVHSVDVITTDTPRGLKNPHLKADAIITASPDVTLFMRFGDCVPILFYDQVKHIVAIAHAGWQGTVNKIASRVVQTLSDKYRSFPADIIAGIGPSIGVDHYEIGPEVIKIVRDSFIDDRELLIYKNGKTYFDLWKANQQILEDAGVSRVETAGICTACHVSDWFSHRGDKGRTGRFGAIISLGVLNG